MIRVVVSGTGNMGKVVLSAVEAHDELEVAGVIGPRGEQGQHVAASGAVYPLHADPAALLAERLPDVEAPYRRAFAEAFGL